MGRVGSRRDGTTTAWASEPHTAQATSSRGAGAAVVSAVESVALTAAGAARRPRAVADGHFADHHPLLERLQGQLRLRLEAARDQRHRLHEVAVHHAIAREHVLEARAEGHVDDAEDHAVAEAVEVVEGLG